MTTSPVFVFVFVFVFVGVEVLVTRSKQTAAQNAAVPAFCGNPVENRNG